MLASIGLKCEAHAWLQNQFIWHIYLLLSRYIASGSSCDIDSGRASIVATTLLNILQHAKVQAQLLHCITAQSYKSWERCATGKETTSLETCVFTGNENSLSPAS